MRNFSAFLAAVFRHWVLLFSGPAVSIALGSVEHYAGHGLSFREYGLISAATVIAAVYRAWLDEHTARLDADQRCEQDRPAITAATANEEFVANVSPFNLRNVGKQTAFNVSMACARLGTRELQMDDVADLVSGASVAPRLTIRGSGPFWAREVKQFFGSALNEVVRSQYPHDDVEHEESETQRSHLEALMGVCELVLPVRFSYRDLAGNEYVSQEELWFEPIGEQYGIRLVYSGRKKNAPALRQAYVIPGSRDERKKARES